MQLAIPPTRDQCSPIFRLAPELRERVYTFCLADEVQAAESKYPREPALTRVSKQVRHESLPIYYSTYSLAVQTFIRCSYHGQVWLRTEAWYRGIQSTKLECIRHFRLNFALIDRYTGQRVPIHFHIHFPGGKRSPSIRHSFARSWFRNPHRIGDPADFDDLISVLHNHLSSTLDDVAKHPGSGNLIAEDIDRLVKIDPDSLPL